MAPLARRPPRSPSRRQFLTGASSLFGWTVAAPYALSVGCGEGGEESSELTFPVELDGGRVFGLSVASGDPSATGVVLWTRINPEAFSPATPLRFQVASDPAWRLLVLEGTVAAPATGPAADYTVKVDLDGRLQPGRVYYYRFVYGDRASRTGRCRTLPAAGVASVKLAVVTCQDFGNGYYGAYRHIAADESVDFLVHLGDFIYESVADERFQQQPYADRRLRLPGGGPVAQGLDDYRFLYRSYRADRDLQAALERHTLIATTDDHEIANDCYWDYRADTLGAPDHPFAGDHARLRRLKLDAQRAWLEYVPARVTFDAAATHPHQASRIYRELAFGDLLRLDMLDTRTYRSPHPCGEGDVFQRYLPVGCQDHQAPSQTILGAEQRRWLLDRLSAGGAVWKVLGNQTFFGRLSAVPFGGWPINVDAWDGYAAERTWLTRELQRRGVKDLVVLTGDLHSTIAAQVVVDQDNLNPFDLANHLGVELMSPAVTSAALFEMLAQGSQSSSFAEGLSEAAVRVNNPHIRHFNSSHYGYATVRFTRRELEWVAYAVDKTTPDARGGRRAVARFRKAIGWPYLIEESTRGL